MGGILIKLILPCTLRYQISVVLRLFISVLEYSLYALIWYHYAPDLHLETDILGKTVIKKAKTGDKYAYFVEFGISTLINFIILAYPYAYSITTLIWYHRVSNLKSKYLEYQSDTLTWWEVGWAHLQKLSNFNRSDNLCPGYG